MNRNSDPRKAIHIICYRYPLKHSQVKQKSMLSQRWVLNYSINVLRTPIQLILCGKISDSLASNWSRKLKQYRYRTLFPLGQITHKSVAKDMCSGVINSETRLIYMKKIQFHQSLLNLGYNGFFLYL